jgi:hypothetical protein
MSKKLPRRKALILTYTLISVGLLSAATVLFFALRPDSQSYRPGDRVEGITATLQRDIPKDLPQVLFENVAEQAGIDFIHFGGSRSTQLPEDMGSGAAWGDFDKDGDLDLFVCNIAGPLTAADIELSASKSRNRLYRNRGNGTFEDVTETAGFEFRGISMGAAWGDFDSDGLPDLVVTNYGPILIYRNNGDGTFAEMSSESRLAGFNGFWASPSWGDYDRDGDIDLYVCGYVDYQFDSDDLQKSTSQYEASVPYTLNPSSYEPASNLLFKNEGGVFKEVGKSAGVDNPSGRSLSASWCDLNEDGWPDLYVANDISDNVLYRNLGDGQFEDVSHKAWVADYRGAMGLAVGDWDNDRDMDMFVTHWLAQENALYDNTLRMMADSPDPEEPGLNFFDIADQTGLGQIALRFIGWGTSFLDYDNDGRQDLWVVNGSTFQDEKDPSRLVPMQMQLFWNKGPEEGYFEVGEALGELFETPRVGRGAAFGDYDNDGDTDAFIVVFGGSPLLLRNEGGSRSPWLRVLVVDSEHAHANFGTKVEIYSGELVQAQVLGAQASYLSQNAPEALFGLGIEDHIDRVVVTFPCGDVQVLRDVTANQTLTVERDSS